MLDRIKSIGNDEEPLINPSNLSKAVEIGLMDAENLKGFTPARGDIKTSIVSGAVECIDPQTEEIISEEERIDRLHI